MSRSAGSAACRGAPRHRGWRLVYGPHVLRHRFAP
jgi:hypothetical protein